MRLLAAALFVLMLVVSMAFTPEPAGPRSPLAPPVFDLQGHRGARGARPENTWPAFRHALRVGAVTLELDVAVSADAQLVVSHEPWMNPAICRSPSGAAIPAGESQQHALFAMDYAEIARYNCGSRQHPDFPEQQPVAAPKPLLADVLAEADALAARMGRPLPFYNIETKTRPEWDGRFHPGPQAFTRLLMETVAEAGDGAPTEWPAPGGPHPGNSVTRRTIIQSFDARTLRAAREAGFGGRLALLVGGEGGLPQHVEALSFTPDVYSPDHRLVDAPMIEQAAARGIAVIPWTVNEPAEMRSLRALGVAGLITDYPRRGRFLLDVREK